MDNIDVSSPYFLHTSDHPGLLLVSHKLSGGNYHTWKRAVLMALTAKNKVGFIDGTISKPEEGDARFAIWTQCNSMISSWILNFVDHEIANSLLYLDSSADMWTDLNDRFNQGNGPRVFEIKRQLNGLAQGSLDVKTYFTKLKLLWDELKESQQIPTCNCDGASTWSKF